VVVEAQHVAGAHHLVVAVLRLHHGTGLALESGGEGGGVVGDHDDDGLGHVLPPIGWPGHPQTFSINENDSVGRLILSHATWFIDCLSPTNQIKRENRYLVHSKRENATKYRFISHGISHG
jgi:hypothetical protein